MGHQRLGTIPTTGEWDEIVATLQRSDARAEAQTARLAADVLDAAGLALERAYSDEGVRYTFFLLTQVVLAARHGDWDERLARHGLSLSDKSSVFDLTSQFAYAVDDHISAVGRPTDLSEMAQRAACEALSTLAKNQTGRLLDVGSSDVKDALRDMSTVKGFSALGQTFFGRFTSRFLNFYLSRATASNLGQGMLRSIGDVSAFNERLQMHCQESARIVRDFCGQWYSKTEYEQGIDQNNTARFMAIACRKLGKELEKQRERL